VLQPYGFAPVRAQQEGHQVNGFRLALLPFAPVGAQHAVPGKHTWLLVRHSPLDELARSRLLIYAWRRKDPLLLLPFSYWVK
jgi:hypothetical protein